MCQAKKVSDYDLYLKVLVGCLDITQKMLTTGSKRSDIIQNPVGILPEKKRSLSVH